MAKETPFKERKRGGDITGRGPARTTLASVMHQGSGSTHSSPDNLRALMKQGSTPKRKTPLKLKQIMKQG